MPPNDQESSTMCFAWTANCRQSRVLLLVVVTLTLLLDYMLLTAVVSIMPEYLYNIDNPNQPLGEAPINVYPNKTATYDVLDSPKSFDGNLTTWRYSNTKVEHESTSTQSQDLQHETVFIGIMFATKSLTQILSNPFVGPLTYRIGYSIPMFAGWIILLTTTLAFACGSGHVILLLARSLHGVGSSLTSVSGMGAIAERFNDEKGRGSAVSISFSGICMGILVGPPLGGIMYQFVGYSSSFLLIAALLLCDGLLLFCIMPPTVTTCEKQNTSLKNLVTDPLIIIASGIITISNIGYAVLECALPLWMIDTMAAARWQQGSIFLGSSGGYLIGATVVGRLGYFLGQWKLSFIGLWLFGVSLIAVPYTNSMMWLIIPIAGTGLAVGLAENSMMIELTHLVDIRHTPVYGSVFAIGNSAVAFGYILGPLLSAALVENISFKYTLFTVAGLGLLVSPLLFILKNPATKQEKELELHGRTTEERSSVQNNEERYKDLGTVYM